MPRVIRYNQEQLYYWKLWLIFSHFSLYSGFNALDKIGWINVVFAMTTAAFIPLYGTFSDIFGVRNRITQPIDPTTNDKLWKRKITLIWAIIIYEIGQIITGAAAGPNAAIQIIIGRSLAGVGNGGIITLLFVVVTDVVPVSRLTTAILLSAKKWTLNYFSLRNEAYQSTKALSTPFGESLLFLDLSSLVSSSTIHLGGTLMIAKMWLKRLKY